MRSMELVSRERMEVAVSLHCPCAILRSTDQSHSNNSPFGARLATTTSLTSLTSSEFSSTKSVSSRTSMLTATTNTVSLSRASATLKLPFSPAVTVS